MAATIEHRAFARILKETTRRMKAERDARDLGLVPDGWRDGKIVVKVKVAGVASGS